MEKEAQEAIDGLLEGIDNPPLAGVEQAKLMYNRKTRRAIEARQRKEKSS